MVWCTVCRARGDKMPYINLNDLVLLSNLDARDIDVIHYNSTIAKIAAYATTLNKNINAAKATIDNSIGTFYLDEDTIDIACELIDGEERTYAHPNPSSISITVPENVALGFRAGVNYNTGSTGTLVVDFTNNSEFPMKIMKYGVQVNTYTPPSDKTVAMLFYCDGINVYGYLAEVA